MGLVAARPAGASSAPGDAPLPPGTPVEAGALLAAGPAGALTAGPGAVEIAAPGGVTELRAGRDGVTEWLDGNVGVRPETVHEGAIERDVVVMGTLRVRGDVMPGSHIAATGDLVVEGDCTGAELTAGGLLWVRGRVTRSELTAGALAQSDRRLRRQLMPLGTGLETIAAQVCQLLAVARERGREIPEAGAVSALAERSLPDLHGRLVKALAMARRAQEDVDGYAAGLTTDIAALVASLDGGGGGGDECARLGRRLRARWSRADRVGPDTGLVAGGLLASVAHVRGSVRITDAGITESDVEADGDVVATAGDGVVTASDVRLGGRLVALSLGGRGDTRVTLAQGPPSHPSDAERIRAARARTPLEIVGWAGATRLDRPRANLIVRLASGMPLVELDPPGGARRAS